MDMIRWFWYLVLEKWDISDQTTEKNRQVWVYMMVIIKLNISTLEDKFERK